ncbi:MAG: TolC family protein [Rubrivivax sp.]|nr:TolC family protein [Rubrivivax sp.]
MKRALIATAALALLAGCASLDPAGTLAPVQDLVRLHAGAELVAERSEADGAALRARVDELLAQPLSADSAVQIALLNHRGLQARLQDLGVAEAQVVELSRLPNPGFSFGRMRQGDEREIERGLHFNLAALLLRPLAAQAERRQLAALQQAVAADALALAAQARKAFFEAVAAEQTLLYMRQVLQAADASAELARRMAEAGNFNRLRQAREHAFYADAALNLARAQHAQVAARERLIRALGLWGAQTLFTLPERLPELPAAPPARPDLEQQAMQQRLDVAAARAQVQATADALGLARASRFVSVFEFGLAHNTSNEGPRQTGWEIGFEIPIFDFGQARVAKAQALYAKSVHEAQRVAIEARSEVREAWHALATAHDIARHHRDEIVPTARRISEENLLRYNGMLIGVFELLADARAQIAAVDASIAALRDYWIADADLRAALVGRPALASAAVPGARAAVATGAAAGGH